MWEFYTREQNIWNEGIRKDESLLSSFLSLNEMLQIADEVTFCLGLGRLNVLSFLSAPQQTKQQMWLIKAQISSCVN